MLPARTRLFQSVRNGLFVAFQVASVPSPHCVAQACALASNAEEMTLTEGDQVPLILDQPYSFTPVTTGGAGPYTYELTPGSDPLPTGIAFDPETGTFSGTPTVFEEFATVTVVVTDSLGATAQLTDFELFVVDVLEFLAPDPLPGNAQVGVAYDYVPTIEGGEPAYSVALAPGSDPIPAGLVLFAASGRVQGTPDPGTEGSYTIDLILSDAGGQTDTLTLNLVIDPA